MKIFKTKKQAEHEAAQRELIISYKRVFGSKEGREVLMDLMNRNHILNSHRGDTFLEGRRAAVLEILENVHMSLEEFDKLLKGDLNDVAG